nr:unnamed protein product [Callosobruchus analis]
MAFEKQSVVLLFIGGSLCGFLLVSLCIWLLFGNELIDYCTFNKDNFDEDIRILNWQDIIHTNDIEKKVDILTNQRAPKDVVNEDFLHQRGDPQKTLASSKRGHNSTND